MTDERFATAAARNENRDERLRVTEEVLKTMTAAQAIEKLNATALALELPAPMHPRRRQLTMVY